MRKKKGYALGGVTTPEQEDSRYRPSANRAPQGMMSSRGTTAAMGLSKGGVVQVNPTKIVNNLASKK